MALSPSTKKQLIRNMTAAAREAINTNLKNTTDVIEDYHITAVADNVLEIRVRSGNTYDYFNLRISRAQ